MERRQFLNLSLRSMAAAAAASSWARAEATGQVLERFSEIPVQQASTVKINLTAKRRRAAILPGAKTSVWSFKGRVLEGGKDRLESIPGSYLGPILRLHQGDQVEIAFKNRISEESVVHWHGLDVPETADGHPRFAIRRGKTYRSSFEVLNRAGTYWYHPHPHGRTGPQVYRGLAGLIIVSDDQEQALDLPRGAYDVPLVLQDRTFSSSNKLLYDGDSRAGFLGETILVNGQPDFVLDVDSRPYRIRLLNGSNTRVYKLAFSDNTKVRVIGTDGGLLRRPVKRPYLTLAPGERYELWVDLSKFPRGKEIVLRSLEFDAGGMGQGMGPGGLAQGEAFDVMRFRIARDVNDRQRLPKRLSQIDKFRLSDAVNGADPKQFSYAMQQGRWTINGRSFEMEAVAAEERVTLGTMEAWDVINQSGGGGGGGMGGMSMPHPVHLHGSQFQVVGRSVSGQGRAAWRTVEAGYVDKGWKDTVLLMPGERVRLLKRFDTYPGLFLQHCHNLEHEDSGMMRNFLIE